MPIEVSAQSVRFAHTKILVVDDEAYMRKVVRTMLTSIGVRTVYEAADGPAGLDMIRSVQPDIVILDWEMPGLDGAGFVRMVRSPQTFPYPDVPIIMLTGHGERSRVIEAITIGVNEFLLKPVSSKALQDRLISVLVNPRPVVKSGSYYGPAPRKLISAVHADNDQAVASLFMVWMLTRYRVALSRLSEEEALHVGLTRELQHRMRNALSAIQAIVRQSLRSDPAQADILNQRIWAGVSDLTLDRPADGPSDAKAAIERRLSGFDLSRFDLAGEGAELPQEQDTTLALVLHALATNAAKYGALSRPGGRVGITWRAEGPRLIIQWRETGGPPVRPPARRL